jgi:SdrD B-like domain
MKSLFGSLRRLSAPTTARRAKARPSRWQPCVEALEDRTVLSTLSTITSNFNGTAIAAGSSVWFNSVAKVQGVGSTPVTIHVTNQVISFTVGSSQYNLTVPDADITLSPSATSATTTFDAVNNKWVTITPAKFAGNVFVAGLAFQAPNGLPGGINPVTWQAQFSTDTAGVTVNWQWAAAVYTSFTANYSALGVKPVDDNQVSQYKNSDHAGTPENFRDSVTGGARGGGGSNFTGSLSATKSVTPIVVSPPGSISGYVYVDANANGVRDQGEAGIAGVLVTLTGTDTLGNAVNITVQTDSNGFYDFTGLQPGTYTVSRAHPNGYIDGASNVGTVKGASDGTVVSNGVLGQITLASGDNGINYNFGELLAGS